MISAAILGCEGPRLSREEAAFLAEANPLGFILFARNVETPDQVLRLTASLRDAVGRDAPILVDQEGGRVQRLRAPHWREWLPPAEQMTALAPQGPDAQVRAVWLRYRLVAAELRAVGIDGNCAPTADVAGPATHPFLANRCFGTHAEDVIPAARACAEGLLAGGVIPVMKHIPGHGRGAVDSHVGLPRVTAARADLAMDFAPFAALSDLPAAMTAHVVFDAIDPDRPATVSPAAIRILREVIGFDGLLMTDDLSMQALGGTLLDRAGAALAAGCDIALHCNGDRAEMAAVLAAAGSISARAAQRAEAALARRTPPLPVDMAALAAEFEALMTGTAHAADT